MVPLVLVVETGSAELLESGDLGRHVLGFQVEVDAVLDRLVLGNFGEHQEGMVLGHGGAADHREVLTRVADDLESERRRPEGGGPSRVVAVERDVPDDAGHAADARSPSKSGQPPKLATRCQ